MKKLLIALALILTLCKPLQAQASPPIDKYAIQELITLKANVQLYEIAQYHRQEGEAGYGYLTLWLNIDGELSAVEEHISNGEIVKQIGQVVTYNGNEFIKFYFEAEYPNRGYPHGNGIYYLDIKYLQQKPPN